MPRQARKQSEADIYHVAIRGVSRVIIFEDDDDYESFLALLERMLADTDGELLAWCLMSNHVHLLFRMPLEKLSLGMKWLESSYASYFNKRHSRVGHLFQDRFLSEPVNDDAYLLTVVRYIHANPEKANIAPTEQYAWSSYGEYLGWRGRSLCSTDLVLGMVGGPAGFEEFQKSSLDGLACIQGGCSLKNMSDDDAREAVVYAIGEDVLRRLPSMDRADRDPIIASLLRGGLSIRQVERITGIGRGVIQRISRSLQS